MGRFVAGVIACLLLVTGGLLWWQTRADSARPFPRPLSAISAADELLPEGTENAFGAPPPLLPEARPQDREARRFGRYDRNRDGTITRTEMLSSRTKDFKKLDADGNNLLSFEEWAVATADRFDGADVNRDGKLTPAEFAITAPKRSAKPHCKCSGS
ncbi:EF-hand domain-containing protein [Sphingobium subterraneum]|uniref:EF-hand domain-containing protein n=1 Tax=Sphingobium subterraneum TaxID=627688 RepID=A0A841IYX1_9SPHN|nr:hypothetical protein [Sphingobium subterraneum]MBB6122476.1 hypothetical protein [Sphingobium subterraneum]